MIIPEESHELPKQKKNKKKILKIKAKTETFILWYHCYIDDFWVPILSQACYDMEKIFAFQP